MTIRAIFEDGVFRPKEAVDLPDRCEVEFEPRVLTSPAIEDHLDGVYAILSQSFATNDPHLAERHNE